MDMAFSALSVLPWGSCGLPLWKDCPQASAFFPRKVACVRGVQSVRVLVQRGRGWTDGVGEDTKEIFVHLSDFIVNIIPY